MEEINKHSNLWVKYGQRKSGRTVTHFQFQFGLKDEPKKRKQLTDGDIEREAKPGETRAAVIARLTGSSIGGFAKPGESWDQAVARKKNLKEVKAKLK